MSDPQSIHDVIEKRRADAQFQERQRLIRERDSGTLDALAAHDAAVPVSFGTPTVVQGPPPGDDTAVLHALVDAIRGYAAQQVAVGGPRGQAISDALLHILSGHGFSPTSAR